MWVYLLERPDEPYSSSRRQCRSAKSQVSCAIAGKVEGSTAHFSRQEVTGADSQFRNVGSILIGRGIFPKYVVVFLVPLPQRA